MLPDKTSKNNDNFLEGIVSKIDEDAENVKIVVEIGAHDKVVSVMSRENVEGLTLSEGSVIELMIKSIDVMLGK